MKLRDGLFHGLTGLLVQTLGDGDRLLPFFFLLIDIAQHGQGARGMHLHVDQFQAQGFGAVKQSGAHVILRQFQQGIGALRFAEGGAGYEVLVDANRAIHFTALAKQIAYRQVNLDRVAVHLQHAHEAFDGLVGLFVEQVVEAPEVVGRQVWHLAVVGRDFALGEHPSRHRRYRE